MPVNSRGCFKHEYVTVFGDFMGDFSPLVLKLLIWLILINPLIMNSDFSG